MDEIRVPVDMMPDGSISKESHRALLDMLAQLTPKTLVTLFSQAVALSAKDETPEDMKKHAESIKNDILYWHKQTQILTKFFRGFFNGVSEGAAKCPEDSPSTPAPGTQPSEG